MAALGTSYDPRNYEPDSGRPDPFPDGQVRFMILGTDVRRTKAGDGSFLVVEHEVQGGPYSGRKWFGQITLENPNVQAVEIGQRQLSALCHCVGYLRPLVDSDALHGRSGEAEVGTEPAGTDKSGKPFAAKNVTKRYILPEAANGAARASPASHAAPPPQQRAAAGYRPWK
jgi:hypothetical protein